MQPATTTTTGKLSASYFCAYDVPWCRNGCHDERAARPACTTSVLGRVSKKRARCFVRSPPWVNRDQYVYIHIYRHQILSVCYHARCERCSTQALGLGQILRSLVACLLRHVIRPICRHTLQLCCKNEDCLLRLFEEQSLLILPSRRSYYSLRRSYSLCIYGLTANILLCPLASPIKN